MEKYIIFKGEIYLNNLLIFMKNHFKSSFKISAFSVLIFSIFFFIKSPNYQSSISFYSNYSEESSSNLFSSIAATITNNEDTDLKFSIEDYLSSDRFLSSVVNKEFIIDSSKITLIEYWGNNYNNFITLNPVVFLSRINNAIMFTGKLSSEEKKLFLAKRILKNRINFKEDRTTGLNTITVSVKYYPELAVEIINEMFNSILQFSNEVTSLKSFEKKLFIESRAADIKNKLNESEDKLIRFVQENKNFISSPMLTLEKDRLQREVILLNGLFISLSDQLEMAKIEEKDTTSPIFLLDPAEKPIRRSDLNFLKNNLFVFLVAFFSSYVFYFVRNSKNYIG